MFVCYKRISLSLLFFFVIVVHAFAQNDSLIAAVNNLESKKNYFNPRKAIIHSAIFPGWGQMNNKKYWKLPIVYGALGTTSYLFFRNLRQYKDAKSAYALSIDNDPSNDYLIKQPYYTVKDQPERIRTFRNEVRQNVDYSVLFFILFWGMNVADAAVDAHLKNFDVSDRLTLQIKSGFSPLANNQGLRLVFNIK